jgi:hypothetical protein
MQEPLSYASPPTPRKRSIWPSALWFALGQWGCAVGVFAVWPVPALDYPYRGYVDWVSWTIICGIASVWGLFLFALCDAYNANSTRGEATIAGACLGATIGMLFECELDPLMLLALALGPIACNFVIALLPDKTNAL